MRGALLLLIAAAAAKREKAPGSVGVCWTRNMVNPRAPKPRKGETGLQVERAAARERSPRTVRNLVLSAGSLRRRHNVSTCLFTDLDGAQVAAAVAAHAAAAAWVRQPLFDHVLADGRAGVLAALDARGREKEAAWARGASTMIGSRLGRIANLKASPFDVAPGAAPSVDACRRRFLDARRGEAGTSRGRTQVTLFLDDDTFLCDAPLLPELLALEASSRGRAGPAVRMHPFEYTRGDRARLDAANGCAWAAGRAAQKGGPSPEARANACYDEHAKVKFWCSGAQGGAIVADRRHPGLAEFADAWLDKYIGLYHKYRTSEAWRKSGKEGNFGGDQAALQHLFAASAVCGASKGLALSFGFLGPGFNLRARRGSEPPRPDCDHPLFGRTHVVHHKNYVNGGTLDEASARCGALCARLNGIGGPAFTREPGRRHPRCRWM